MICFCVVQWGHRRRGVVESQRAVIWADSGAVCGGTARSHSPSVCNRWWPALNNHAVTCRRRNGHRNTEWNSVSAADWDRWPGKPAMVICSQCCCHQPSHGCMSVTRPQAGVVVSNEGEQITDGSSPTVNRPAHSFITHLRRMHFIYLYITRQKKNHFSFMNKSFNTQCNLTKFTTFVICLQCFDAVGWAAGRASGL